MENITETVNLNKKEIIIGILLITTIIMQSLTIIYMYYNTKQKQNNEILKEETLEETIKEEDIKTYQVDIKGEVKTPGTYKINSNKRVIDVIKLAGGLTKNADTTANNLSLKVTDEMVIIIYSKEQIKNFSKTKEKEDTIINNCNKTTNNIKNDSCIIKDTKDETKKDINNSKISINKAPLEELMNLPGIGEAKAKSIIEYRNTNGEFKSIEEIKNVAGIGNLLYDQIKNHITT